MDVDDEGSLDPRIQIELENLNSATDDINKLEQELNEAHTAFRQLLSDSTRRLKEISDKLGTACIEKARCYYEALEVARQAQIQCQQQARLFQRASEIHAAAKETVAVAEARFVSHKHEWSFDQAWQDMLNHATIKVMDAENKKAECGREHRRRAQIFQEAEKRLVLLEEKHRKAIIRARKYFEVKAQCDQMLETQKERVECLQKAVKEAKTNYSRSLRALEEISNQIHEQRRDYDIIANGPREPGVGAELSTEKHKDTKIEKLEGAVSNNEIESEENLSKRSVDGSESKSTQWELEIQASMEKLNKLMMQEYPEENILEPRVPNRISETKKLSNETNVPGKSFSSSSSPVNKQSINFKELSISSFFGTSVNRGKSCSLMELDRKRDLKTIWSGDRLTNIQSISTEKLASVRRDLVKNLEGKQST